MKLVSVIARIEGQGMTLETTEYVITDEKVIGGVTYYYRLRQVDLDGIYLYSDIRSVVLSEVEKDWILYPNPIDGKQRLTVELYSKASSI
ncbi:MAG: hypothetical protein AAGI23_15310 [Bacteroidota bacterium]